MMSDHPHLMFNRNAAIEATGARPSGRRDIRTQAVLFVAPALAVAAMVKCVCAGGSAARMPRGISILLRPEGRAPAAWFRPGSFRIAGLVLAGALVLTACQPPKEAAHPAAESTATKAPAWAWEDYPATNVMRLGMVNCVVQPKRTLALRSPAAGRVRLYVQTLQTNLTKDTLWAELTPELYTQETNSLHRASQKLAERIKILESIELPKATLKATRDQRESERQMKLISVLNTNAWLQENAFRLPGLEPFLRDTEARRLLATEHSLNGKVLTELAKTNWALLGNDPTTVEFELEQKTIQLERKRREGQIRMPFDGELTVSLPLAEGVEDYLVGAGDALGVATDPGAALIRMAVTDPRWLALPTAKLSVQIDAAIGASSVARFSHLRRERAGMGEQVFYYFEAPKAEARSLLRFVGGELKAVLFYDLDSPARVVSKLKMIMHRPEVFRGKPFAQGVTAAWPGAIVLMEGQLEAAILLSSPTSGAAPSPVQAPRVESQPAPPVSSSSPASSVARVTNEPPALSRNTDRENTSKAPTNDQATPTSSATRQPLPGDSKVPGNVQVPPIVAATNEPPKPAGDAALVRAKAVTPPPASPQPAPPDIRQLPPPIPTKAVVTQPAPVAAAVSPTPTTNAPKAVVAIPQAPAAAPRGERLKALLQHYLAGEITEAEYRKAKAEIMASGPVPTDDVKPQN